MTSLLSVEFNLTYLWSRFENSSLSCYFGTELNAIGEYFSSLSQLFNTSLGLIYITVFVTRYFRVNDEATIADI